MKVIKIIIAHNQKVNTGNYTTKDYFCSLEAKVREDEDLRVIGKKLYARCKAIITDAIRED